MFAGALLTAFMVAPIEAPKDQGSPAFAIYEFWRFLAGSPIQQIL
jgi:hypothetical protein